jgi:hypothetical protein
MFRQIAVVWNGGGAGERAYQASQLLHLSGGSASLTVFSCVKQIQENRLRKHPEVLIMYEMSLFVCIGQESYFLIQKSPGILLVKLLSAEVSIYLQQLQVNIRVIQRRY